MFNFGVAALTGILFGLVPALRASTDAFHLAMGLCVALLVVGAAINLLGAQPPRRPAPS